MSGVDLSAEGTAELLSFTRDVAISGGKMIREAFDKPLDDYERKTATDPVTETDKGVEAFVFAEIRKRFSDHRFIGEESAADNEWSDEATWIVDPIDGTANCKLGYRLYCEEARNIYIYS